MPKTIGNPLSWGVRAFRDGIEEVEGAARSMGGIAAARAEPPQIRRIGFADIEHALRRGFADFSALRSDAVALILLYPLIGLGIVAASLRGDAVQLIFPAVAGFALLGPLAAVGLYEMSKRREAGLEASWLDAFAVFRLSTFAAIFVLGLVLIAIFSVWLAVADGLYAATIGDRVHPSLGALLGDVFGTAGGAVLLIVGTAVGALFAALVLSISVVSFPLLVDRRTTLAYAVLTSVRVTLRNPVTILGWGAVVTALLVLGSLPLLIGLVVVLPVLGHATWHLYRRAVVAEEAAAATAPEGDMRLKSAPAAPPGRDPRRPSETASG